MARSSNSIVIFGAILSLAGIAAFAVPRFTTDQNQDVAQLGGFKIQAEQDTSHSIPLSVSGGAFAIGIILIAGGVLRRR